jgi:16S rRNA (guanine527-N7)-methyltransferase
MKGSLPRDEIEAVAGRVRVVGVPRIEVPGLDAERHLVIMEPRAA